MLELKSINHFLNKHFNINEIEVMTLNKSCTNIIINTNKKSYYEIKVKFLNLIEELDCKIIYFNSNSNYIDYQLMKLNEYNKIDSIKIIFNISNFKDIIKATEKNLKQTDYISLSFTGPDGSGKTTVLEIVEEELSKIFREVKLNHFRPTVIPRIAEVFNKAGLKKEVDVDYSNPHRGGKTGKLSSLVRLFYYIFDYIYGYFKIVKPVLFRRGVVIFDRYYTDIIADSKRSKINLPYKFIKLLKIFVPNMKYNFLFYVEPDNILARKQELTKEQIIDIYEKLDYILENDKSYKKIDNNKDPKYAVAEILNHIFENQHKKNIKRI